MILGDIESLRKNGEKRKLCPYYVSREMAANADLIFLPYNYLVDPRYVHNFVLVHLFTRPDGVLDPNSVALFFLKSDCISAWWGGAPFDTQKKGLLDKKIHIELTC